jgi:hypothetical protein
MTPYTTKDLAEGWEFKIVRSSMAAFRKPEKLQAILDEEARGGWTLVEKFDNCRIRLKRPVGSKMTASDFDDGYDPYRTTVGPANGAIAGVAIAFAVAFVTGVAGLAALLAGR